MAPLLRSVYIHNYKSFQNFTVVFDGMDLLMGGNGSGKSSVFEVIALIQQVLAGEDAGNLFNPQTLTRWAAASDQVFELVFEEGDSVFKYRLVIGYDLQNAKNRIQEERLTIGDTLLAQFELGTARVFRDDGSKGPEYPFDWKRSLVGSIPSHPTNRLLTRFREIVSQVIILKPNPSLILPVSEKEESMLLPSLQNFASWYRYISLQDQGIVFETTQTLQEVIEGFSHIDLRQQGDSRVLTVNIKTENSAKAISYRFDELSDGQKQLICLYILMGFAREKGFILFLDEPDNYLSLPEIQPWLLQLYDDSSQGLYQTVLITHHPVPINYLTSAQAGKWFFREKNGPTRLQSIGAETDGLAVSQLVERGWIYEP